jgi:hypothetical protein
LVVVPDVCVCCLKQHICSEHPCYPLAHGQPLEHVLMTHLSGKANPSDILSTHWGHQAIYPILRPILFFSGNTADLIDDNEMTFIND